MTEPPIVPPPPAPGPEPERRPPAVSVGLALVGVVLVVPLSFLLVFALQGPSLGARAAIFAGVVFIVGGSLCFVRSPQARGIGIGLMTGWALLSITTGGVCTGLQELVL